MRSPPGYTRVVTVLLRTHPRSWLRELQILPEAKPSEIERDLRALVTRLWCHCLGGSLPGMAPPAASTLSVGWVWLRIAWARALTCRSTFISSCVHFCQVCKRAGLGLAVSRPSYSRIVAWRGRGGARLFSSSLIVYFSPSCRFRSRTPGPPPFWGINSRPASSSARLRAEIVTAFAVRGPG
jgi:hypothetical protein